MTNSPQPADAKTEDVSDTIWGYAAIGREINRSPSQVRYLLVNTPVLNNAVRKLGHKTIAASRRRLRDIVIPPT